jgi:hypothetical protein
LELRGSILLQEKLVEPCIESIAPSHKMDEAFGVVLNAEAVEPGVYLCGVVSAALFATKLGVEVRITPMTGLTYQ